MYGFPPGAAVKALNAVINGDCQVSQFTVPNQLNTIQINNTATSYESSPDGFAYQFEAPGGPFNIDSGPIAGHPILGNDGFHVRSANIPNVATAGTTNAIVRACFVEVPDFFQLLEQNVALQFWARTTLQTGPHYMAFNVAQTSLDGDKFIQQFSISQLNVWEQFFIPMRFEDAILSLPAPGSQVRILGIYWPLVIGTLRQGTAAQVGTWLLGANNRLSGPNPPQYGGTAGRLDITDVSLTIGAGRPPFFRPAFMDSMARCQRYYQQTFPYGTIPRQNIVNGAGGTAVDGRIKYSALVAAAVRHTVTYPFSVSMRGAPTVTFFNPEAANANWRNETAAADSGAAAADQLSEKSIVAANPQTAGAAVGNVMTVHASFDARMT